MDNILMRPKLQAQLVFRIGKMFGAMFFLIFSSFIPVEIINKIFKIELHNVSIYFFRNSL